MPSRWKSKRGLAIREVVIFAMLGTDMFVSKLLMEGLPNMHLIGVLTVVYTLVYRWKALCPLYVFVFLTGLYGGFNLWWLPYLYIWAVLWGATMLLPRRMPAWLAPVVYALVCSAHGFLYGTLYAPAQALMFGLSFQQMIAWILAGLPWDAIHGVSNLCLGVLICPLTLLLRKVDRYAGRL